MFTASGFEEIAVKGGLARLKDQELVVPAAGDELFEEVYGALGVTEVGVYDVGFFLCGFHVGDFVAGVESGVDDVHSVVAGEPVAEEVRAAHVFKVGIGGTSVPEQL